MLFRTIVHVLFLGASLSSSALASTYIVDVNGSGQFTDIPPAISAAQPGDVLLVLAGSYSQFTLSKGLTIVGYGTAVVSGAAHITNIPLDQRAVVLGFSASDLIIDGCAGPVVAQELPALSTVRVMGSRDVRLSGIAANPPAPGPTDAAQISASRAEIVDSNLRGSSGFGLGGPYNHPADGGTGLSCPSGGHVHVVRTMISGGWGGDTGHESDFFAGDGGAGVVLEGGTLFDLVSSGVGGGVPGTCFYCRDCAWEGVSGFGIYAACGTGASDRWSNSTVGAPPSYYGPNCEAFPGYPFAGCGHVQQSPPDPDLHVLGTPTAGQTLSFILDSVPGATAMIWFGRSFIVQPTSGVNIELLTPKTRALQLGVVPSSGTIMFRPTLPAYLPQGFVFCAQAEVVLPTNEIRRTNSVPIVVR